MAHKTLLRLCLILALGGFMPAAADAQFVPRPLADAPLAERYIIEAQGGYWNPAPTMSITSESLGIIGSTIDFKSDLGLKQTRFKAFRATLHPARKHKFRFEYIPIDYHSRLGESKIRARHAYDFTLLILRTIVYFNPLRVFIPLGVLLTLTGIAKLSVDLVRVHKFSGTVVISFLAALIIWWSLGR